MSAAARSLTTLHGVAECIVTVPYQLGYHPHCSLVLICLGPGQTTGSRSGRAALTLTARVDLPAPGQEPMVLDALLPALRRSETCGMIAIVFDDDRTYAAPMRLLGVLTAAALTEHVEVAALARVCGDRWLSIPVCDQKAVGRADAPVHPESRRSPTPNGWLALPAASDVPGVANYVLAGRSPLSDRQALAQVFGRSKGDLASGTTAHTARLRGDHGESPLRAEVLTGAARALGLVVRSQGGALPAGLTPSDLACCALALEQVLFRDAVLEVLSGGLSGPAGAAQPVLSALRSQLGRPAPDLANLPIRLAAVAGQLPESAAPALLSVVGYLAWCRGEGAVANIAIETALDIDPSYSMARLIDQALAAAVSPPQVGTRV